MKGKLLVLTLAILLTAGGASFAFAMSPHAGDAGRHDGSCEKEHGERHAAMAALLGLTAKQQAQIKSIITEARQTSKPLREKLAIDRKKIKELSKAEVFDEAAVRTLIAGDESVRTDLAVARIKVRHEIQAVLTPEQRVKAKELRSLMMHGKHGKMGHESHGA